jgi:hypothetical protein
MMRYCSSDTIKFPAGAGLTLVYSKLNRAAHVLPDQLVYLLDQCRTFKTLAEHARDCCRSTSGGDGLIPQVEGHLMALAAAGLLVAESEIAARLPHACASFAAGKIATVGIVTRNRAGSLRRCLTSYIENSRRHGRANDFVVMDNSEEAQTRDQIRWMLQSLKHDYGVKVSYAGREEKTRFASALTALCEAPPEIIDFALFDPEGCGCSIGANRNALLLHTAGDLAFGADDDTVCRIAPAPDMRGGLAFDSRWEIMRFWFFPNHESALRAVAFVEEDILGLHERLVGRSLSDLASSSLDAGGLRFDQVDSRPLRDIERHRGRVLATFNGIVGDSGMHTPVPYLVLGADSRARLVRSEQDYLSAWTSREVLRVVDREYISASAWCVTTAYAFDNRSLLPPFMPVLRSEDDLFGLTLQACFDDGYFGYLPWALVHAPAESRTYPPDSITSEASSISMLHLMLAAITSFRVWPGLMNEAERLRALGRHLIEIGSLRQPDFEEFARLHIWRLQCDYARYHEQHLAACGAQPEFWASDIRRFTETLRRALPGKDYLVPRDLLAARRDPEEARCLARRLVFRFGQLLHWWPELVEAARTLRDREHRLAQVM